MSNGKDQVDDVSCESFPSFKRNNYFSGKLLTAKDFQTEQQYFINKQRLINRLIHGAGVVCGLEVLKKGEEGSGKPLDKDQIRITAGIALDSYGREIVVPTDVDISLAEKLRDKDSPVQVWIKYDFCVVETAPKVLESSSCKEENCPSTIKESYVIEVKAVEGAKYYAIPSKDVTAGPTVMPPTIVKGPIPPIPPKRMDLTCKNWDDFLKDPKKDAFCTGSCPQVGVDPGVLLATVYFSSKGSIVVEQVINNRPIVHSSNTLYRLMECLHSKDEVLSNQINSLMAKKIFPKISSISWKHDYSCRSIKEWIEMCNGDLKIFFNMTMKKATINNDTLSLILEKRIEAEETAMKDYVALPLSPVVSSAKVALASPVIASGVISAPVATKVANSTAAVVSEPVSVTTVAPVAVASRIAPSTPVAATPSVSTPSVSVSTGTGVVRPPVDIPIKKRLVTYIEKFELPFEITKADSTQVVFSRVLTDPNNERLLLDETHLKNLIAKKIKLRLRLIIQLKGDFVLGQNGKCLDGNFLRGQLPTGNDCEGGLFESWFSLEIPGVREELEISPKVTEVLVAAGKSVDTVIDKARDTGLKVTDFQKFTPADLSLKLDIPEEAASEVISTVKAVEEFRELDETDYDSLKKIKAEGLSLTDVAKSSSTKLVKTIGVSKTTASSLISKAKEATQPKEK